MHQSQKYNLLKMNRTSRKMPHPADSGSHHLGMDNGGNNSGDLCACVRNNGATGLLVGLDLIIENVRSIASRTSLKNMNEAVHTRSGSEITVLPECNVGTPWFSISHGRNHREILPPPLGGEIVRLQVAGDAEGSPLHEKIQDNRTDSVPLTRQLQRHPRDIMLALGSGGKASARVIYYESPVNWRYAAQKLTGRKPWILSSLWAYSSSL